MRHPLILLAALLAVWSAATHAAEHQGWYAALSAGVAPVNVREDTPGEGFVDLEDDEFAKGVEIGYAFHPHLALEAGYQNLGEPEGRGFFCPPGLICTQVISDAEADFSVATVSLVPTWAVSSSLSIYAELGAAYWELEPTLGRGSDRQPPDIDETDFRAALGGRLSLAPQIDLQLEAATFDEHQTWMLGLRWWL